MAVQAQPGDNGRDPGVTPSLNNPVAPTSGPPPPPFKRMFKDELFKRQNADNNPLNGKAWPASYASVKKQRQGLPAMSNMEDILTAFGFRSIFITGQAGSGKSTQVPQAAVHFLSFNNNSKRVLLTQPRRTAARGVALRLAEELGVSLGEEVSLRMRDSPVVESDPRRTRLIVATDGILTAEIGKDPELSDYAIIILDEVHERALNTDIAIAHLKTLLQRRNDLKVILMSATGETEKFRAFFESRRPEAVVELRPLNHIRAIEYLQQSCPDYVEEICRRFTEILNDTTKTLSILAFAPGKRECDTIARRIREVLTSKKRTDFDVHPLYRDMPSATQEAILGQQMDGGRPRRKFIVATNVAETSLTIPNVQVVIDSGWTKISKAEAVQRAGRVGRERAGFVYRLYTQEIFDTFAEHPTAPILRSDHTDSLLMRLTHARYGPLNELPEPPYPNYLNRAVDNLRLLNAIDDEGRMTPIGKRMATLSCDARLARALLASLSFKCSENVLDLVAVLSIDSNIYQTASRDENASMAHKSLRDFLGDHFTKLNVLSAYRTNGRATQWAADNYVSGEALEEALRLRGLLAKQLQGLGFKLERRSPADPTYFDCIGKSLLTGLISNVGVNGQHGYTCIRDKGNSLFYIDEYSDLKMTPKYVMYTELSLNPKDDSVLAKEASVVKEDWLVAVLRSNPIKHS